MVRMARSTLSRFRLPSLAVMGAIGLGVSCGSPGEVAAPKTISVSVSAPETAAAGSLLVMPAIATTMAVIDRGLVGEIAEQLGSIDEESGFADQVDNETVPVTFRLGPRMASKTFEIGLDGEVSPEDAKQLRRLFRCRRSGRSRRMHRGLYAKLADLAQHYEGRTIEVVSAYRHGPHAKRGSRHRDGRAIDIKVAGVPAAKVRDYLWARYDSEVGVGFYKQQQFVHLDHRTNYPATAWTQKHHSAQNEYKPRWARSSRRSRLVVALADDQE